VNGAAWMVLDPGDMSENMGLPHGISLQHKTALDTWKNDNVRNPPSISNYHHLDDYRNNTVLPLDPLNYGAVPLSLVFVLDNLLNIDGVERELEVQFTLAASWEDVRINTECVEDGLEDPPNDPCGYYWMPSGETYGLKWPNAKEVNIIEDFGTHTNYQILGDPQGCDKTCIRTRTDTEYYGYNPFADCVECTKLPIPQGATGMVARGIFTIELDYHRFPFDEQNLDIQVQLPVALPRNKMFFDLSAAVAEPLLRGFNGHNLWTVKGIKSITGRRAFIPGLVPDDDMDYWVDGANITVVLQRKIMNYFGNYILLEVVLCILGLCTLFIPADSIDGRLGIGLTLVLAMNVFQVVLVENMPSTGYLTDMHIFTIANTTNLSLLCAESILVYAATKHVEANNSLRGFMKELFRNNTRDEVERAVVKLQAATRGLLIRKRLRRALNPPRKEHPRKPTTTSRRKSTGSVRDTTSSTSAAMAPSASVGVEHPVEPIEVRVQVAEASEPRRTEKATVVQVVDTQVANLKWLQNGSTKAVGMKDMRLRQMNIRETLQKRDGLKKQAKRRFRQSRACCCNAVAQWIVDYLDAISLVLFPVMLAVTVAFSFKWSGSEVQPGGRA